MTPSRCARTALLSFVAGLFLSLSAISLAQEPDCRAPDDRHIAYLEQIAEGVAAGNWVGTRDFVVQIWSQAEDRQGWKAPALEAVGAWMVHSETLTEEQFCTDEQGRPVGYYLNELTGMVDLVRFRIDEADADRIASLDVRTAVRIGSLPEPGLSERERLDRLEAYVDHLADHGAFSGTVLLARDGVPLLFKSHGFADKAGGITLENDSSYNVASLNKIFTAVAVLQLVDRGKLRLDSRLSELLPDEPMSNAAGAIEVRHLLSHTSGAMSGLEELAFPPGTDYRYSNFGFGVLGQIIEEITAISYDDYLRLNILGPSGMAQTASYHLLEGDALIPGLVRGYGPDLESDRLKFIPNPWLQKYPGSPVGGYYSTAGDLLKFAQNLKSGALLNAELVAAMRTARTELGAEEYGYGTMLWRGPGIWGHAGDLPGADADLEIYGDTEYVAVVLGNFDQNNPAVLMKIRALFFPLSVPATD